MKLQSRRNQRGLGGKHWGEGGVQRVSPGAVLGWWEVDPVSCSVSTSAAPHCRCVEERLESRKEVDKTWGKSLSAALGLEGNSG